jgi:hypothetical protein
MSALTKIENIPVCSVDTMVNDVEKMHQLAKKLVQSKHYQKMGEDGIFAIGMMAKTLGMPVLEALNGELYYVQGRVGMAAEAMNKKIRMAGHSITLKKLDETGCIIIGKRCDTGDTAEVSYGIEDMRSAGKNYDKNKKDMFWARALSRLKRILFPDIGTKCYEKSELEEMALEDIKPLYLEDIKSLYIEKKSISSAQAIELSQLLSKCDPEVQKNALKFIQDKFKIVLIDELPEEEFDRYNTLFTLRSAEYQKKLAEAEMLNVNVETGEVKE